MSALKIKKGSSKHSAYDLRSTFGDEIQTHTLAILVDNDKWLDGLNYISFLKQQINHLPFLTTSNKVNNF